MSEARHHTPPAIPFEDLPRRMSRAREGAGFQQKELAAILGCHPRTIINYENGHTEPRMKILERWAEITNVPADWLMLGITPEAKCSHCGQATLPPQQLQPGADTRSRCLSASILVGEVEQPAPDIEHGVVYGAFDDVCKGLEDREVSADRAMVYEFPHLDFGA